MKAGEIKTEVRLGRRATEEKRGREKKNDSLDPTRTEHNRFNCCTSQEVQDEEREQLMY